MRAHRLTCACLVALIAAAAPGCGYRMAGRGTQASFIPRDVKSIGIPLLKNDTTRPELGPRLTESLIDEFVRRAHYEAFPTADKGDLVLEGTVESYRVDPVSYNAQGRFDRVEVLITARVRLYARVTAKVLWSQNHFVFRQQYDVTETQFTPRFDLDILAIEGIGRDFARSVVTSILEGF